MIPFNYNDYSCTTIYDETSSGNDDFDKAFDLNKPEELCKLTELMMDGFMVLNRHERFQKGILLLKNSYKDTQDGDSITFCLL